MQKQKYVGKTLEDALDQAARDLGTERENIAYNIVPSEGGSLLKKFLFKSITVEAWLEKTEDLAEAARKAVREAIEGGAARRSGQPQHNAPRDSEKGPRKESQGKNLQRQKAEKEDPRSPQAPRTARPPKGSPNANSQDRNSSGARNSTSDQPKEPRQRRPRELPSEPNPNAITFDAPGVTELLTSYTAAFLKVFDADIASATFERNENGNMVVKVESELLEDLLARSDRLSSSYEHVFKRIMQKKLGDLAQRLHLEAGNASEKRLESLRQMAMSMAEKVKETGRSITVNSKSGQERRIIHVTIDEIEGVATRSVGTGESRKLVIYSTNSKHKRNEPRRPKAGARDGGQRVPVDGEDAVEGSSTSPDTINGATHLAKDGAPRRGRSRRGRSRGRRGGGADRAASSGSQGAKDSTGTTGSSDASSSHTAGFFVERGEETT